MQANKILKLVVARFESAEQVRDEVASILWVPSVFAFPGFFFRTLRLDTSG